MPFDALSSMAVSRNGVEIGKLRVLSDALRAEMPKWKWNFSCVGLDCGTPGCAMGMAYHMNLLSPKERKNLENRNEYASYFGLMGEAKRVFFSMRSYPVDQDRSMAQVTPAMVADALDAIIAREEAA